MAGRRIFRLIYSGSPTSCGNVMAREKTLPDGREPSLGRDLVDRLDRASVKREGNASRSGAELNIGFLLWPSFPLLSLAGFCDALRHAADLGDQSRPLRCAWMLLGMADETVEASCGVAVPVHAVQGSPRQFDYLVVIGGLLPKLEQVDRRYWDYLREADAEGVPLIGMCTGSFVLAKAGLMRDRVACVHAFHLEDYKTMFPDLRVIANSDYLIDGNRITCAGGVSVVERRKALGYLAVGDLLVRHAIVLMEENLEAPLNVTVIAKMTGTSVRQLERNFLTEMGVSPKEFYRTMRLRYARWLLLNTEKRITVIAYECGFADSAHFIRGFREVYGVTPGRLRVSLEERLS